MSTFTVLLTSFRQNKGRVRICYFSWSETLDVYVTIGLRYKNISPPTLLRNILVIPWLDSVMLYGASVPHEVRNLLEDNRVQSALYEAVAGILAGPTLSDKAVIKIEPAVRIVDILKIRQAEIDKDGQLIALRLPADSLETWNRVPEANALLRVIESDFEIPDEPLLFKLTTEQQAEFNAGPFVYEARKLRKVTAREL
jgi:hypothetical protein